MFRGTINKPTEQSRVIQCKGFRLRAGLRDVKNGGRRDSGGSVRESPLRVRQVEKSRTKMVMDITFSDATVRLEVFWDE